MSRFQLMHILVAVKMEEVLSRERSVHLEHYWKPMMRSRLAMLLSQKEVYEEVIAKSKAGRAQRAAEKEHLGDQLEELDAAFLDLQGALRFRASKS